MGSSSSAKTQNTNTAIDNKKAASDNGIVADNSTVTVNNTNVSADVIEATLKEASKTFGVAGDLAETSVKSSAEVARLTLENNRATVAELIRSNDSSISSAKELFSAAATGGVTQVTEQAASITKVALIAAAFAVYFSTRK